MGGGSGIALPHGRGFPAEDKPARAAFGQRRTKNAIRDMDNG